MKRKLIIFAFLFPIGELLALMVSNLAHASMTTQSLETFNFNIIVWIQTLATNELAWLLFLCLSGISLLCIGILVFRERGSIFESELNDITDRIKTPVKAGQNQNGSARWLSKKEFHKSFASVEIDGDHPVIQKLMSSGCEDLENGKVEHIKDGLPLFNKGGIVLGMTKRFEKEQLYYVDNDLHTLCIGSTRSGKSRGVVLQSIGLLGLAGESLIVSDPKTELFNYTSKYLEKLGYEVIILDYRNPLKSDKYNFLQPVIDAVNTDDLAQAVDRAWDITYVLVGESQGEKIWNDGEKSVIASTILAVVCENKDNPEYQNLTNVYKFISEMCTMTDKEPPISRYLDTLSDDHPAKSLMGIANVAPPRTRGSFYTSALMTLNLFTNPLIYDITCESSFKPKDIGERKVALFIALPDEKETYYKLASLFIVQQYQMLVQLADKNGGKLKQRVNLHLDEFGNFVQMPRFATIITVSGGRGMRFNLFVQSLSQIAEKYGKEASSTIKANCHNWIYLRTDDPNTLDEISKKLGNYTVGTNGKSSSYSSSSSGSSSVSISLTGRPLLTPDEVRMVGRPYSLITSDYYPAMFNAPDLTQYMFNEMFGLGDVEHNRQLVMKREENRAGRTAPSEMKLWGIWHKYKMSRYVKKANMHKKNAKPTDLD